MSLLSVIPFSKRKTEIVSSSSVKTMDVWLSQTIKIVIYKPMDVLKSGNVSMYKALLIRYALDSLWQLIVRTNDFFDFSLDRMWQTTEYLQSSPNTGRMNFMKTWRLLMYVYCTSLVSCMQKASRVVSVSQYPWSTLNWHVMDTCHGHLYQHLLQNSVDSIHAIKSVNTCEWVNTLPTTANRWLSCWPSINQDVNGMSMESQSRAVINTWTQMHLVHLIASL